MAPPQTPLGGAYSAPPDPLAGLRGPTSKGRGGDGGGRGKVGKEGEGREGEGSRGEGKGDIIPPILETR